MEDLLVERGIDICHETVRHWWNRFGPMFAADIATVAVLFTPIAVSLAEAPGASPRPFLVAVMIAGSAAFATPFGYQTNVLVYQIGGYNYLDFVKIGIPLRRCSLLRR